MDQNTQNNTLTERVMDRFDHKMSKITSSFHCVKSAKSVVVFQNGTGWRMSLLTVFMYGTLYLYIH